jgi:CubicO group peptidase (beta-lactamase class C family)
MKDKRQDKEMIHQQHPVAYQIQAVLDRAVQEEVSPGFAFHVGQCFGPQYDFYAGQHQSPQKYEPPKHVSKDSIFDLASLTKPLASTHWAFDLISKSKIKGLDQKIGDLVLGIEDPLLANTPIFRLLNHTSGLPAHFPYYEGLGQLRMQGHYPPSYFKEVVRKMIKRTNLEEMPGNKGIYSDLGYLLLEICCQSADQDTSIDLAFKRLNPHTKLHFQPINASNQLLYPKSLYLPTENCAWRKERLQGFVHDDNAWLMGGVCGHAGLFGRLNDVVQLAYAWLKSYRYALGLTPTTDDGQSLQIDPQLLQKSLDPKFQVFGHSFALGWDQPSRNGYSSAGHLFGKRSIGHLGFTGTSIWMDIDQGVLMVLLSNRVYFGRNGEKIRAFRPQIHQLAWSLFT